MGTCDAALTPNSGTCDAALMPNSLALLLQREATDGHDSHSEVVDVAALRHDALQAAMSADAAGDLINAVDRYHDLYEMGDDHVHTTLIDRLSTLYPMGDGSRISLNASDSFRRALEERVAAGEAEQLSAEPPIFMLRNLCSAAEAAEIREVARRRRAQWSTRKPPLIW